MLCGGLWCFFGINQCLMVSDNSQRQEMPQKQKTRSWSELKQAGNECFKTGQYGEATDLYSHAIKELEKSSK